MGQVNLVTDSMPFGLNEREDVSNRIALPQPKIDAVVPASRPKLGLKSLILKDSKKQRLEILPMKPIEIVRATREMIEQFLVDISRILFLMRLQTHCQ